MISHCNSFINLLFLCFEQSSISMIKRQRCRCKRELQNLSYANFSMKSQEINAFRKVTLLEKCPNTELFLVRIFPHLERIRRDCRYGKIRTRNNSVFGHFSRSVMNQQFLLTSMLMCFAELQKFIIITYQSSCVIRMVESEQVSSYSWQANKCVSLIL